MNAPLVGGYIQRVAVSALNGHEIALLKVRVRAPADNSRGENVHLVLAAGLGLGLVDGQRASLKEAVGADRSPAQAQWRSSLEGGRVVGVAEEGAYVECRGRLWQASAAGPRLLALDECRELPGASAPADPDLAAAGARILERLLAAGVEGRSNALRRAIHRAIAKLDRRIAAVLGDLARMQGADEDADRAIHFVAEAARAPRGARKLLATDWTSGKAECVEWALDPARGAKEQIDAVFKRARRLKEGARISRLRLADAQQAREALVAVGESLGQWATAEARVSPVARHDPAFFDQLEAAARSAAPRDFRLDGSPNESKSKATGRHNPQALPPFRTFLGASGARILVGRGAAHNDTLTFRVAKPHDLWLHAKGYPGAHVVVPLTKGVNCPSDLLVEAAHLAAHFSGARDERLVDVHYAPRGYLRKPRGSGPGLVVVDREKVLLLRREEEVLRRVLEREVPHSPSLLT